MQKSANHPNYIRLANVGPLYRASCVGRMLHFARFASDEKYNRNTFKKKSVEYLPGNINVDECS